MPDIKEEAREATEAEKAQQKRYTAASDELGAMQTAFAALDRLPEQGRRRAMRWLDTALFAVDYNEEPPF